MRDRPSNPVNAALRACRSALVIVAAFSLATNVLALASPLYMMQLFDKVLSSRSGDTLVMLTLVTAFAVGVLCLLDAIRSQVLVRVGDWLDDRLGPTVFGGALALALKSDAPRAALAFADLQALRGFFSGPAVLPLLDAPWTPIFVIALFVLHPDLGFVGLAGGVALLTLALINEFATRHPLRLANAATLKTRQRAEAALRNAEVIRAMGMSQGVVEMWRRELAETRAAAHEAGSRGSLILGVSRFFRLMLQIVILGVGAWLVIAEQSSPGAMFAASFLLARALAPVESAIGTWRSLVSARLSYHRLVDLLADTSWAKKGMELPVPEGALNVERVSYIPPGSDEPTLRGVSFNLLPGEVLGVVGPSAAGKSTLARLVAGTWRPTAGKVRLDDADIAVWHASGGSVHIGYLPQDIELFAGTVRDNIARMAAAKPDAVIEAAQLVGLHGAIMNLPAGYDSEIGDGGIKLSGGLRQRIALARAVFGRPRLVVLDEPNASLDQEGDEALHAALLELKRRGATVLIVAHRPSILGLADKLLVLRNGMVDVYGNRADVIAKLHAPRHQPVPLQRQSA
ncbi:MAG TPA: type I secretion system permease/ATPase [Stellaceae bacterium]|nr:type I secretion system permease/ATPase [Stellaceae bacterium]